MLERAIVTYSLLVWRGQCLNELAGMFRARTHAHTRERARRAGEGERPNHANCIINRAFYMTSRELCRNPALGNCIPNLSAPAASMDANKELCGVWLRTKSPFAFMYLLY